MAVGRKRRAFQDWLTAIVLTAALCGAAALFEVKEPENEGLVPKQASQVVSLPDPLPRGTAPDGWQARVLAWADLRDPTVLSLPHPTRGFSGVRANEFERPVQDVVMAHFVFEAEELPRMAAFAPQTVPVLLHEEIVRQTRLAPPTVPSAGKRTVRPTGILWLDKDGAEQADIPPLVLPDPVDMEPQSITGDTVLNVRSDGKMLRVRIVRSCGSAALDGLALQHVRSDVLKRDPVPLGTEAKPLADQNRELLVVWRNHPAVSDRRSLGEDVWHNGEESWYDLDWY